MLTRGQAVALAAVASEKEYSPMHGFKLEAPVGRQIYVKVNKGVRGFGGYLLGETFQTIVDVPEYPRQLKLLQSGALLALSGERKVSIYARDVARHPHRGGARAARAAPAPGGAEPRQLRAAAVQLRVRREPPGGVLHRGAPAVGGAPGQAASTRPSIWSKYMDGGGGEKRGLFLLKVESWDVDGKRGSARATSG